LCPGCSAAGETIYIFEGAKAVDILRAIGFAASTDPKTNVK
jgi:hypothetical protein